MFKNQFISNDIYKNMLANQAEAYKHCETLPKNFKIFLSKR